MFPAAADRGMIGFRRPIHRWHMTSEQLRLAQQAAPFQPFSIHLPDGRKLHVPHPEFLSVAPTGRIAVVYQEDGSASVIDVLLVTALELQSH